MNGVFRFAGLLLFSFCVLASMSHFGVFSFSNFLGTLLLAKAKIFWMSLCLFVSLLCLLFRYIILTRVLGIKTKKSNIAAAVFVSSAIGHWLPGSIAVTEAIRWGLMFGIESKNQSFASRSRHSRAHLSRKLQAKLAIVSVFDRLSGFFAILLLGSISAVVILNSKFVGNFSNQQGYAIFGIGLTSIFFLVILFLLPFILCSRLSIKLVLQVRLICRSIFVALGIQRPCEALETIAETKRQRFPGGGFLKRMTTLLFLRIDNLTKHLLTISLHAHKILVRTNKVSILFVPVILSLISTLSMCTMLYISCLAAGQSVALASILTVYPVLSIVSLLPLGLGGIGGTQIVSVWLLSLFNLEAQAVSSASLLQNIVSILGLNFVALVFAFIYVDKIKLILKSRILSHLK